MRCPFSVWKMFILLFLRSKRSFFSIYCVKKDVWMLRMVNFQYEMSIFSMKNVHFSIKWGHSTASGAVFIAKRCYFCVWDVHFQYEKCSFYGLCVQKWTYQKSFCVCYDLWFVYFTVQKWTYQKSFFDVKHIIKHLFSAWDCHHVWCLFSL